MANNSPAVFGKGPFDQAIVDGFSKNWSMEEVSANAPINGILTPAQCLSRLTRLVKSKDVLDANDKLALLLEDVYWLRNKLRDQMEKTVVIDEKQAAVYLRTIESLVKRVETVNLGMGEAMLRFNELRATEFVEALTFIVGKFVSILEERHPELEVIEVQEVVLEAIPDAIPKVD